MARVDKLIINGTTYELNTGTNTWRPIKVNDSSAINDTSTTVNFKGAKYAVLSHSSGTITITGHSRQINVNSNQVLSTTSTAALNFVNGTGTVVGNNGANVYYSVAPNILNRISNVENRISQVEQRILDLENIFLSYLGYFGV